MKRAGRLIAIAVLVMAVLPASAWATNGYFSHGYGTQSKGMAGAGVAIELNSLAPATNPAGMGFLDQEFDVGLAVFNPDRQYTVTGAPSGYPGTMGLAPGTVTSGSNYFPVPSLGINWVPATRTRFGIAVYGNGGMNTNYDATTFGFSPTGVDLAQMFVAPTLAQRWGHHSVGISPIIAYQRFKAEGLQAFAAYSSDPENVSNNGYDNSFGFGARAGYLGKLLPQLSVGAAVQSRVYMGELSKYSGLFADQGMFDVPANWTLGVAVRPVPKVDVAFDVQQIYYSSISSVGNPMLPNMMTAPLGAAGGAGFGWNDMTVWKIGTQWRAQETLTLRAGYSYGQQPIPAEEVLFNILAPGVMEHHLAAGLSKTFGLQSLHLSVMHAFSSSVEGPNPMEAPGAETITLEMKQWEVDLGWGIRW